MLTQATPTASSTQLTTDQFTVVAASISSLLLFLVILMLLAVLYRKDPSCCKVRPYQEPQAYPEAPLQYYSSRQTLVGSSCHVQALDVVHDNSAQLPDYPVSQQHPEQFFVVGLPSSYPLPILELPLPRLPSYESVRKRDRQQRIHMMIADRFGLRASIVTEPPPTYEESIRQSMEVTAESLEPADIVLPPVIHFHVEDHVATPQSHVERDPSEDTSAFDRA